MSRYGEPLPRQPERWDADRFARERGGRQVLESERFEERDRYASGGGSRRRESSADDFHFSGRPTRAPERFEEKDRFFAEERYGPPARRPARRQNRYYEEEEIDSFESSPEPRGGQMIPFGGRRAAPRPGMIRRQSSLDTFDRKPLPRYREPPPPPEVIAMPAPSRRWRSPPRYERDYEDIRVEDDFYGGGEFRGYKEREIETTRRRRGSEGETKQREVFEVEEEKPFPRKGITRMSTRLVNKRAIIELGYSFEEEVTPEVGYMTAATLC